MLECMMCSSQKHGLFVIRVAAWASRKLVWWEVVAFFVNIA